MTAVNDLAAAARRLRHTIAAGTRRHPAPQQLHEILGLIGGTEPTAYVMQRRLLATAATTLDVRCFDPSSDSAGLARLLEDAGAAGWVGAATTPGVDPSTLLLTEQGGAIVGCCWLRPAADLGEILLVAVDRRWRRHGIGSQLVRAGIDDLVGRGCDIAQVTVATTDTASVSMFITEGFSVERITS